MAKREKVISMAAREKENQQREAELYCGAVAKDPTPESRAYFDSQLDADPEEWRRFGDLADMALDLALKDFWLGYATKASVKRGAEMLRRELGHEEASPAERVLIEHAVLCHVRLGMVEHLYSRATSGSSNVNTVEHYERR